MSAGLELDPVSVPLSPKLKARRLGVHSQQERLVFMRTDCHVCRAEGLRAHSRVLLRANGREALATLYQVDSSLLAEDQAGISERVWSDLSLRDGDALVVSHAPALDSMSLVRGRIYGQRLAPEQLQQIMSDMVAGRYTDVEIAAFVTGCAALPMDEAEVVALTRVMVDVGDRLRWDSAMVMDKHSVGGLPGNRTTPIVVAIVAAHGLTIPKTSSRAITSPAGTADTMETLAPVDLDLKAMRRVVEQEAGCIVWGGAVSLSPADDTLIRVERALDIDSEGQLIASVLSKKIAAGATHLVLDIPVGDTAKVRARPVADMLSKRLTLVAQAFGIHAQVLLSDGSQPVGRGIGPALEARDVLAILQNSAGAPLDLRRRACVLAGALLEMGGVAEPGGGAAAASAALDDGRAWRKFVAICEAQGGMRSLPRATQSRPLVAARAGRIGALDNRRLARLAKLAGAPAAKAAGLEMHVKHGDQVAHGEPLCTIYAESPGELTYALEYAARHASMIEVNP